MSVLASRRLVPLAALLLLGAGAARAAADDGRNVVKNVIRATAQIKIKTARGESRGTGWVVDRERMLLVTNYHVVAHTDTVNVVFPAYKRGKLVNDRDEYKDTLGLPGRVVDADPERDLAIIRMELLPEGTAELKLSAEGASPGDRVRSVGTPGASEAMWVAAEGSVRSVYRKRWAYQGGQHCHAYVVETQAPTNPGDSGGAMVGDDGEVVGVVSGRLAWFNGQPVAAMNWGIDVREVKAFLEETRRLLDPRTAADYAYRGDRLIKRFEDTHADDNLTKAVSDLTRALRLDPRCAPAYRNRGRVFLARGDRETALADFSRAAEADPRDAPTFFYRGLAESQQGPAAYEKAVADYTTAIQLNPAYSWAFNNRGVLQGRRGQRQLAFEDYNRAIEADPDNAQAYSNRGHIHLAARDYAKAKTDFEQAARLSPTAVNLSNLAMAQNDLGNYAEAIRLCDLSLKEVDPKHGFTWGQKGFALEHLKQYAAAVASYGEAVKNGQKDWWTYNRRAHCYEEMDSPLCTQDYAEVAKLRPELVKDVKLFKKRYLRIVNQRNEAVTVRLYYETLSEDNEWTWFPAEPPGGKPLEVQVGPNESKYVFDKDFKVKGRRVRVWAEGASGFRDDTFKDKDAVLVPAEGYRARKELSINYIIK